MESQDQGPNQVFHSAPKEKDPTLTLILNKLRIWRKDKKNQEQVMNAIKAGNSSQANWHQIEDQGWLPSKKEYRRGILKEEQWTPKDRTIIIIFLM